MALDPRVNAVRPDLAARKLQGQVTAPRFAEPETFEVVDAAVPVMTEPSRNTAMLTEALHGERIDVYDRREGWVWGQLVRDHYVGYLPEAALTPAGPAPTHKVTALASLVFPGPDIKLPPSHILPMGAVLSIDKVKDKFALTGNGGYVPACHLSGIGEHARDFVQVAEQFAGAPYLWGGKRARGLDCSGLVQIACQACGFDCPRDSDLQERALGTALDVPDNLSGLARGDLIFWPGHVGIMVDAEHLLHANAHHMSVTCEKLRDAVTRIAQAGLEISSIRRF